MNNIDDKFDEYLFKKCKEIDNVPDSFESIIKESIYRAKNKHNKVEQIKRVVIGFFTIFATLGGIAFAKNVEIKKASSIQQSDINKKEDTEIVCYDEYTENMYEFGIKYKIIDNYIDYQNISNDWENLHPMTENDFDMNDLIIVKIDGLGREGLEIIDVSLVNNETIISMKKTSDITNGNETLLSAMIKKEKMCDKIVFKIIPGTGLSPNGYTPLDKITNDYLSSCIKENCVVIEKGKIISGEEELNSFINKEKNFIRIVRYGTFISYKTDNTDENIIRIVDLLYENEQYYLNVYEINDSNETTSGYGIYDELFYTETELYLLKDTDDLNRLFILAFFF